MAAPTFELMPSRRDAVLMTTVLWAVVLFTTGGVSILTGAVSSAGEYLQLLWATSTALLFSVALYKVFEFVQGRPAPVAYAVVALAVLALAAVQTASDYAGQFGALWLFGDVALPPTGPRAVSFAMLVYVCLYGFNFALFLISAANQRSYRERLRLAETRAQAAKAELAALHYQLNPHFLMNSLNSVSTMIMDQRYAEADDTVVRMAGFLRDVLKMEPAGRTSLADELARTQRYLDIQRIRFPDRFSTEISCPDELAGALVPSLILQPLAENAVKYAVAPSDAPVMLSIRAAARDGELRLVVEDNGQGGAAAPGTGIGLANVQSKLHTYYGPAAGCTANADGSGFRVELHMPLELQETGPRQHGDLVVGAAS